MSNFFRFGNDIVEFQRNADTEDMLMPDVSRILVIYTGGTIGMKHSPGNGYEPATNYLSESLASMTRFHDPEGIFVERNGRSRSNSLLSSCSASGITSPASLVSSPIAPSPLSQGLNLALLKESFETKPKWLVTPPSLYGKRIRYAIKEYPVLLDSCNITMADWIRIATDIETNYQKYDAFIVLHGTDTMAYTASALSFMLENLGKTVIITGSQVPISEVRTDAIDNLLGALTIAGHFVIPEVALYFGNKLMRGNRCSKFSAIDFEAFDSPNLQPLVKVGVNIEVNWTEVLRPQNISCFRAQKSMNAKVASLRLFPGITDHIVDAFLSQDIEGVVLETYGSGNAPDRPGLINALKKASARGVVIVSCSQCRKGTVLDIYASAKGLKEANVIPGNDMTAECALTKLSYLLSKGLSVDEVRSQMRQNLRGELTGPLVNSDQSEPAEYYENPISTPLQALTSSIVKLDITNQRGSKTEKLEAKAMKSLLPLIMCSAASANDVQCLKNIQATYGTSYSFSCTDYTGRTPLHIASSNGCYEVAEFLLKNGAVLHLLDQEGHTPLFYAARHRNISLVQLLVQTGAHFNRSELPSVIQTFLQAASTGNFSTLRHFLDAKLDINIEGLDKRTALHTATLHGHLQTVKFICSFPGLDIHKKDSLGQSAYEIAIKESVAHPYKLELKQIIETLKEKMK